MALFGLFGNKNKEKEREDIIEENVIHQETVNEEVNSDSSAADDREESTTLDEGLKKTKRSFFEKSSQ